VDLCAFQHSIRIDADEQESEFDELRDDLLAVVTFFVARNNGRRSAQNRLKRKREGMEEALPRVEKLTRVQSLQKRSEGRGTLTCE